MPGSTEITRLLQSANVGNDAARDELLQHVYGELHALAHRQLLRGGRPQMLCTTALVHEAFLRMVAQAEVSFEDRAHFLGYCSRVMRSVVVDEARRQSAGKRGAQWIRLEWDDGTIDRPAHVAGPEQILALDQAMEQLREVDPRLAEVTEMRIFGGLETAECGIALGMSERTVKRDWRKARALLAALLSGEPDH